MDEAQAKQRFLKLLGVSSNASASELRAAYENQSKKWRTDCLEHNPELTALAKQKLVEIQDAFECLSEPEKLRKYLTRTVSEKSVAENAVRKAIADKTAAQAAIDKAIANQSTAENALRRAELAKNAADKAVNQAVMNKATAESLLQKARVDKAAAETAVIKAVDAKSDVESLSVEIAARLAAVDPTNKMIVALHAAGKERKNFGLAPIRHRVAWLGSWGRDLLIAAVVIATPLVIYAVVNSHVVIAPIRIHLFN